MAGSVTGSSAPMPTSTQDQASQQGLPPIGNESAPGAPQGDPTAPQAGPTAPQAGPTGVPQGYQPFLDGELIEPKATGFAKWGVLGGLATAGLGAYLALKKGKVGLGGMMAAGGLATAGLSSFAWGSEKGIKTGQRMGQDEFNQVIVPQITQTVGGISAEHSALRGLVAQLGGDPNTVSTDLNDPNSQGPTGPAPGTDPNAPANPDGTPGETPGSGQATPQAPAIPAGQWTPASIIGQAVSMPASSESTVGEVAPAGMVTLVRALGSDGGYGTFEEAFAIAQQGVDSKPQRAGTNRWVVVEHEGRFHPYEGSTLGQPTGTLPADNGTVVGSSSVHFVPTQQGSIWIADQWTRDAGHIFTPMSGEITGAMLPVLRMDGSVAQAGTSGPSTEGTPGAPTSPTSTQAYDAASEIALGFTVPVANFDGGASDGGYLQLQQVLTGGGVASAEEAANAARTARDSAGANRWARYVVTQSSDGRWHAYAGSLVDAPVNPMSGGAQPAFILGYDTAGVPFSQHFDGQAWQTQKG